MRKFILRRMTSPAKAVLAALALVFSGVVNAGDNVLRFAAHADLKNTDPIWTTAKISTMHGWMIYDTLFGIDSNYVPQPQMVDTWTRSDDGLNWTFTLRAGMKWHDGDPVRAADAVASVKRWGSRDAMGMKLMAVVDYFEPDNELTFTMKLNKPFGMVLQALAKSSANIPFIMIKPLFDFIKSQSHIQNYLSTYSQKSVWLHYSNETWLPYRF